MRYAVIYNKENDNYSYLDIINGVHGVINKNRIIQDSNRYLSESQGIIFINNNLPTEDSKYFLLKHLGSGKLLYIDTNGKIKVDYLSIEELRYVSNELTEWDYSRGKKEFMCYEKQIVICDYASNFNIMMAIIHLYNRDNTVKGNEVPSSERIDSWIIDTLKIQEMNHRYKVIHNIGNKVYILDYVHDRNDSIIKKELLKKVPKTFTSIDSQDRHIIPLIRVVSDNLYYYVFDTTLMKSSIVTKKSIRKVSFQEIVKIASMDSQGVTYCNTKIEDGFITISGLDGAYKYNIDEVNKFYNVEIVTDMMTLSRRMLGKEADNIIINNRHELLMAEPIGETLNIPIECKVITKNSIYARQLFYMNIHKNVTSIQADFMKEYPGDKLFRIIIDNSTELELIGVFKTIRRINVRNIRVILKNKLVNYKDIKYVLNNTVEYFKFERLLEEDDIKKFLQQYSIKELDSFKWLDEYKIDTIMLNKWRDLYTLIGMLNLISDDNAKKFIEIYKTYIDNKVSIWYNKCNNRA